MALSLIAVALLLSIQAGEATAETQVTAPVIPESLDSVQFAHDYEATLEAGRDETFAKVGDSNTDMKFNIYGLGCRGDLNLASPTLQATVDKFKKTFLPVSSTGSSTNITCPWVNNSFNRLSAASRSGAVSTQPLLPSSNVPRDGSVFLRDNMCSSDAETTLACEIRLTNARYTIIGGGSNDIGWENNPNLPPLPPRKQRFEDLVSETRANSSIPILQTIPAIESHTGDPGVTADNAIKVEQMNQVILDVAEEMKVPVINLWAGLKDLPRQGLARDGIHLSHSPEGGSDERLIHDGGDLSDLAIRTFGANARSMYLLRTLAFLESNLDPAPPTSMNFDSISIAPGDVTSGTVKVKFNVSGSIPPGATTVITKSLTPRGTSPVQTVSPSIGANELTLSGLDEATTYYVRAITTYGTPPNQFKIASSEISATTKGDLSTEAGEPESTVLSAEPFFVEDPTTVRVNFTSSVNGPGPIGNEGTKFKCSLGTPGMQACLPPKTFSGLRVGSHEFWVQSSNQGEWGPITKETFTVSGPNVTITNGPAEGSVSTNRNPSFTSASTEPVGSGGITYTLKWNGFLIAQGSSSPTKSFTGLPDGSYEFSVNWADPAGNQDPGPPVRKWSIEGVDATPPNVTIPYPAYGEDLTPYPREGWPTNNNDPVLKSESNEPMVFAGIAYTLRKDGQVYDHAFSGPVKNFYDLPDGDYEFTTTWADAAGNVDTSPPVRKWSIDTVVPETTISAGPANSSTSNNNDPEFTFSSNEPNAFLECRIWQGSTAPSFSTCVSPKAYANLATGSWKFQVRSRDLAGNVDASPSARNWTITP